jgi:hypothetical protein
MQGICVPDLLFSSPELCAVLGTSLLLRPETKSGPANSFLIFLPQGD